MSEGFESQTLRDTIQPREPHLSSWQKAWVKQQTKDVEVCPMRSDDWICSWSIKYREGGAVWCHGRYYRDGCSVWKMVQANDGDPSVLIKED